MTQPYMPVVLATPIVNPAVGSQGPPPIPYLSNAMYTFAPTAIDSKNLNPAGGAQNNAQVLADTIRRASRWADTHCFGADACAAGATLAASLSVENVVTRIKQGTLRLICDYRPIIEVIGIDVGANPGCVTSIGPNVARAVRIGRRGITVPLYGFSTRSGDIGNPPGSVGSLGGLYAVWSYVYGYPHTKLVSNVVANATSCVVQSTDGNGGVWGVPTYPYLTIYDTDLTETVQVTGVTPGSTTTTLTTTPFANGHTIPSAPDFLPMTALSDDITQAVISLTNMLIKSRGSRALVMPKTAGGAPSSQALAQTGATRDWEVACKLLKPYRIATKSKI